MKTIITAIALLLLPVALLAQKDKSIIKSDAPITWLGMDFSNVSFIGSASQWQDAGTIDADELQDKYFNAWNTLFETEQKKYDVAKYVDRKEVTYAIDVVKQANKKSRKDYFTEDESKYGSMTAAMVQSAISKYNLKGKSGIGLVFVMEAMHKENKLASAWVTFIDMGSKKVLQTKRIEGKAGGFGFRNFWAGAFFKILKDVASDMK